MSVGASANQLGDEANIAYVSFPHAFLKLLADIKAILKSQTPHYRYAFVSGHGDPMHTNEHDALARHFTLNLKDIADRMDAALVALNKALSAIYYDITRTGLILIHQHHHNNPAHF